MAKTIYLNSRSNAERAIKMLEKTSSAEVVLVLPKSSKLSGSPGELHALKRAASELGKRVVIATTNRGVRSLAQSIGFEVVQGKRRAQPKGRARVSDLSGAAGEKAPAARTFPNIKSILPKLPPAPGKARQAGGARVGRKGLWRKVSFVSAIVIILALIALFILPEATIVVASRSEPVTRDMEIRVSTGQDGVDVSGLAVPGELLEREAESSQSFTPSGKRNIGKRASGFVQIYNLSKNTLILGSETTTLSSAGRAYGFTQNVGGIRPTAFIGQGDDAEVDPSSLTAPVPVVAAQPGEQYNLPEGTRVEIANQVLGSQPEVLYGIVSEGGLTGGTTQEIRVLTETDVLQSLETVTGKVLAEAADELAGSSNQKLLESAVKTEVLEQSVSSQVGDETDQFSTAVRVRIKALVFSPDDVSGLIKERVERLLPENKTFADDAQPVLNTRFFVLDLDQGSGLLDAHFESRVVYRIDDEEILPRVTGKTPDEVREVLLSRPEISDVSVALSPFWVNRVPRLTNRINIDKTVQD